MEVENCSLLINIIITKLSIEIQILLWTIMETVFTLHYNCEFIFPSTLVKVESKPKLSSWYYCSVYLLFGNVVGFSHYFSYSVLSEKECVPVVRLASGSFKFVLLLVLEAFAFIVLY